MQLAQNHSPSALWRQAALWRRIAPVVVMLATALAPLGVKADGVVVKTISGGPNALSPIDGSGFVNSTNFGSLYYQPYATALDSQGNLYVADKNNHAIRKLSNPTSPTGKTTTLLSLGTRSPVGIAIDASDTMYVATLEDMSLRKYVFDIRGVPSLTMSNHLATRPAAMTVARDGSGNAYVALTNGTVYMISPSNTATLLVSGFKKPAGITYMASGLLALSDAGNHAIYWFSPTPGATVRLLAGLPGTAGFFDGPAAAALFNQPAGIAAAGNGALVVADRANHRVRMISAAGVVQTLYGVDPSEWSGDYPGWMDSSVGTPQANNPVSVTISTNNIIYVTELAYNLIRTVTGTDLSSTIPPASTPLFTPSCGYYRDPVTITVSNLVGAVYYTKDGTLPSPTNGTLIPTLGGVGTFIWNDITRDLSVLKLKTYYGTNESAVILGGTCGATTPLFSPMSGFFPNGTVITVTNTVGAVAYTVDGSEPGINNSATMWLSMNNAIGYIPWTNRLHDLGYLRIKAINGISPDLQSVTVRGIPLAVTVPTFYPECGYFASPATIFVTNFVGEVHYTTDGTEPTLNSPMVNMGQTTNGYYVGSFVWDDQVRDLGWLRVKAFIGATNYSPTVFGQSFCIPTTPVISPTCGYFPNGQDIVVSAPYGNIYYTTNGTDPTTNSFLLPMVGGIGRIHWTNSLHDLSWLRVKAFNGDVSSDTVQGESCPVTAPTFTPSCGYYTNCIDITVNNAAGEVHYTVDGTEPTLASPVVLMTNGWGVIRWCDQVHDLSSIRMKSFSGPDNYSQTVSGEVCQPSATVFAPVSGYYPDGVTIWATNTIGNVYYTTDGSDPTIDSFMAVRYSGGVHRILWADAMHDLSSLRMKAIAGTNVGPTAAGQASLVNEIGFTHDYFAGPGSTAIIPVVMNLRPNVTVRTILLSVDITPDSPNTNLITSDLQVRRPLASDFIPVLRPVSLSTADYKLSSSIVTLGGVTSARISVNSTSDGFYAQNHAVVALVCVPLPVAGFGSSWHVSLSHVSATTDGRTDLPLTVMPARSLILTNISFQVGDVTPTVWYNGPGAFGDGQLKGSDINTVIAVSMSAPPFGDLGNSASPEPNSRNCDLYNAMDVWWPAGIPDGVVDYMDSQTLLNRYWGQDTNAWLRSWTSSGLLAAINLNTNNPVIFRARAPRTSSLAASSFNGNVWLAQGKVTSSTLTNVNPGQMCAFPVYVDMMPGCPLPGMQFVATVQGENGAPSVGSVQFVPDIVEPQVIPKAPNDAAMYYPMVPIPYFDPPLQGHNHLGDIYFQVPSNAVPKQAYTVHFSYLGGAADLQTPYTFESLPATAWVQSAAQRPQAQISDEWKIRFFKSTTNVLAQESADPDGDGLSNLMEYIAGTNPTNNLSRLQFLNTTVTAGGQGVVLSWLSAPDKNYSLEWSAGLPGTNWTVLTNMTGDGGLANFVDSSAGAQTRYYRLRVQAP